ncbi:MAG: D-alanine--D-alanine ligase [Bacillota bacterium]
MAKSKICVIYGGRSGEHEVSVQSAASVIDAINSDKYEVIPIGITKNGKWAPGVSPRALIQQGSLEVKENGAMENITGALMASNRREVLPILDTEVNVVFPVLHGPFGEDGTIQGLLELADIAYVGGGVLASALGMDKIVMKMIFQANGIPVGDFLFYTRKQWEQNPEKITAEISKKIGLPCFIKPANLGSSVGISKAHNHAEIRRSMDFAARYDRKIIVEAFIKGREIECSVLGNDDPIASVPGEIVPCAEFYDYEAKYIANDSKLIIPAALSPELTAEVQDLAVCAYKAIDCAGMARVDFFLCADGKVFVNEINTIPGFTKISMYPKLWEASGLPYTELINRLIELALERKNDKDRNQLR